MKKIIAGFYLWPTLAPDAISPPFHGSMATQLYVHTSGWPYCYVRTALLVHQSGLADSSGWPCWLFVMALLTHQFDSADTLGWTCRYIRMTLLIHQDDLPVRRLNIISSGKICSLLRGSVSEYNCISSKCFNTVQTLKIPMCWLCFNCGFEQLFRV